MARTRVRLRALTITERALLTSKIRDLTLPARFHQRYRIVASLCDGHTIARTSDRIGCRLSVVYHWVNRFNASGFLTFELAPNPRGRPPKIDKKQLRALCAIACSSPATRGLPFSRWSVPKLADYCRRQGVLPELTDESVRRTLHRVGFTANGPLSWRNEEPPR